VRAARDERGGADDGDHRGGQRVAVIVDEPDRQGTPCG